MGTRDREIDRSMQLELELSVFAKKNNVLVHLQMTSLVSQYKYMCHNLKRGRAQVGLQDDE